MGFGLICVLLALAGFVWLLRRFGGRAPQGSAALKIISAVPIGTRERLIVVEIAETWLVVGVAPGRISPIHTMPKGESQTLVAATEASGFPFWLKQVMERSRGVH